MALSSACKFKTNKFIRNPSDRSSKPIPKITFLLLDLRNVGWNNPGCLLLEILSSNMQLCGPNAVAYTCLIRYDVTAQALIATNMSDKRLTLVGCAKSLSSEPGLKYTDHEHVIPDPLAGKGQHTIHVISIDHE